MINDLLRKLLILPLICISIPYSTIEAANPSKSPSSQPPCNDQCQSMRISARHIENKGIGYNTGYTTLEAFLAAPADLWSVMPFVDLRGHIFNDGHWAANGGLGLRSLLKDRIYGAYAYYDYRDTKRKGYNQVSFGLETLGTFWDLRFNGYAVVGSRQTRPYDTQFSQFSGNNIYYIQKFQYALSGGNAEVGFYPLKMQDVTLYTGIGPYYLKGPVGGAVWGGQTRAKAMWKEYVGAELSYSYDHAFKNIVQGQVFLSLPLGPKGKVRESKGRSCMDNYLLCQRMIEPVVKNEIIPVTTKKNKNLAINPATGQPYTVYFVNNLSHSAGTYESPFSTLAAAESAAQANDIIYVYPGDGTTTGLGAGVTLKDYQKLWGSGIAHALDTTAGAILVPAQSGGTLNGLVYSPTITNTGTVVTLGNGNEISGLFLQNGAIADAILVSNKTNATVSNCTIAGANVQGGTGLSATELAGTLTINNCILNQNTAISLANSTTNLQANITNSSFSGGDSATTSSISWNLSDAAQGVLTASNNTFDTSYIAITVTPSNTSTIAATINNNSISAGGYGININGSGTAAENINIDGNTINTYYQSVRIVDSGVLIANLSNNTINTTEDYCIEIDTSAGEASILMTDNTLISSDSYTLYLNHSGGSLSATLNGNNIYTVEDEYAIYSDITGSAIDHVINLNGNTIAGEYCWYLYQTVGNASSTWNNNILHPYEYGIYADQQIGTLSLIFNNNTVISSGDEEGIYWAATGSATNTNISITGNQIYAEYPIYCQQEVGNLTLSVTDNILTGYNPIYLTLSTSGTTTSTISENTCNGYYGIEVAQSAGTFNSTVSNNIIASAGTAGYYYAITGGAPNTTQLISGNTITSGAYAANAVYLDLPTAGTTSFTVTDNVLAGGGSSSAGASVSCTMLGGTQFLDLSNNSMTNTGGFSLSASNACEATWNVNSNEFFASGSTPVSATASVSGTSVCMQLNNNTAYPITGAYSLTRTSPATFILNPPQGNIGQLTIGAGVIEAVCP